MAPAHGTPDSRCSLERHIVLQERAIIAESASAIGDTIELGIRQQAGSVAVVVASRVIDIPLAISGIFGLEHLRE